MIMEDSLILLLKATLALMFGVIGIDIYFLINRKKVEKKLENQEIQIAEIERSYKAKEEDMSNVLKSLRKLHESVEEVNKLKKEVNEIKVSRK